MKNKRGFAHIALILIVGIIGLLFIPVPYYQGEVQCAVGRDCPKPGIYFQPSVIRQIISNTKPSPAGTETNTPLNTIDTRKWETYVDDELQISFKYPTDWEKLIENNNRIEFTDSAIVKDLPAGIVNQEYCTRERDCYPVARIKLSIVENESEGAISNQKLSQTLINGLPAKSYYYSKDAPYPYATYFTLPNETILLVEAWLPSQTNCQGECPVYDDSDGIIQVGKEIEQILSTFEFIKSGDKNTFTSKKLQNTSFPIISITHPSHWKRDVEQDSYLLLNISNGEYTIQIAQDGWDGGVCLFEEDEIFDGSAEDLSNKNYVEIEATGGLNFRRYETDFKTKNQKTINFCQFEARSGKYIKPGKVASIQYLVPENYDGSKLREMDEIVKTLQIHE